MKASKYRDTRKDTAIGAATKQVKEMKNSDGGRTIKEVDCFFFIKQKTAYEI